MKIKPTILATIFFLFSCNSGNSRQSANATPEGKSSVTAPEYDHSLKAGNVTDSVICRNNVNQNFALYLPSDYSSDKKYPCIYFFDAHARGSLPLRKYKDLAEKYGFVMIGSNVSKNGISWEVAHDGVKLLIEDTRARINMDPQRVYTAGFSGGSRVAGSVAIVDGGVAGVIGCAAGFPVGGQAVQNKFDYFGIAGEYDFNLIEMQQLDKTLQRDGFNHQLLTFDGIHDWPPFKDFETGLCWMQINAMKKHLQPVNDTLMTAFRLEWDKRISSAKVLGDWIKVYELTAGVIRTLDGLYDVTSYKKQMEALIVSDNYKKAIAQQEQLQQIELTRQHELAEQFTTQDEKWWEGKISELNKKTLITNTQESRMSRRLLSYVGLVGYMNSSHAINAGDLPNAATYLKVFKLADPQNPDGCYLSAHYFMKMGDISGAIAELDAAVSLGFSDVSQLISDPAFSSLHDDKGFENIMIKVRANRTNPNSRMLPGK